MTERLSVLLDRREVHGVVSQLSNISEHVWPSCHLAQASRHHSHQRKLFASDLLTCSRHHWLDIDVLSWGITGFFRVNLVLVGNLHEETSTVLKENSILQLVLAWCWVRVNHLQIVRVKV